MDFEMIIDGFLVFSSCLGHCDNLEVVLGSHSDLSHLQYIFGVCALFCAVFGLLLIPCYRDFVGHQNHQAKIETPSLDPTLQCDLLEDQDLDMVQQVPRGSSCWSKDCSSRVLLNS